MSIAQLLLIASVAGAHCFRPGRLSRSPTLWWAQVILKGGVAILWRPTWGLPLGPRIGSKIWRRNAREDLVNTIRSPQHVQLPLNQSISLCLGHHATHTQRSAVVGGMNRLLNHIMSLMLQWKALWIGWKIYIRKVWCLNKCLGLSSPFMRAALKRPTPGSSKWFSKQRFLPILLPFWFFYKFVCLHPIASFSNRSGLGQADIDADIACPSTHRLGPINPGFWICWTEPNFHLVATTSSENSWTCQCGSRSTDPGPNGAPALSWVV